MIIVTPVGLFHSYQQLCDISDLQAAITVDGVVWVILYSAPCAF